MRRKKQKDKKFTDKRQEEKAWNNFHVAMDEYFKALRTIEYINPNVDQLNTVTRLMEKLTKVLKKIKDENYR